MSARIVIGKYLVKADTGCGWVAGLPKMVSVKDDDGNLKLVEVMNHPTYHGRLDHAFTSLLNRSLRESDVKSLTEVRDLVDSFRKMCEPLFKVHQ